MKKAPPHKLQILLTLLTLFTLRSLLTKQGQVTMGWSK